MATPSKNSSREDTSASQTHDAPAWLQRFFAAVIAKRFLILAFYALVLPPAGYFAARVQQDNAIDRIISTSNADLLKTREFEKVFGSSEFAVLFAEADDPYAPAVLERIDNLEKAIAKVPRVEPNSIVSVYRRAKGGFEPTPETAEALRKFATGTTLLREQGLVGDGFLSIGLVLDVHTSEQRHETLGEIKRVVAEAGGDKPPLKALREVGQPFVNLYLDEDTQKSAPRYFALFMAFVVVLNLALYKSVRTLIAFLITLGACVALSMGYIGITGGILTIVSPMVPMTILVTATATLVYLHSRYVDRPADRSADDHLVFSLANKWLACTASIFATAVGFAALKVSPIEPIEQMGIWVAVGLAFSYITIFTLFPVLEKVLKTPTGVEQKVAAAWFVRLTAVIPRWSYKYRWPLVAGSLLLSAAGAVALLGLPGVVKPMKILVDPVEYINPNSTLYQNTRRIEQKLPGLSLTEVWLKGGIGSVSEPEALVGFQEFHEALAKEPQVGTVLGPTTIVRLMQYLGGEGDEFPTDPEKLDALAGDLEGLAPTDPLIQKFIQKNGLGQTHFTILSRASEPEQFEQLAAVVKKHWDAAAAKHKALSKFEMNIVGMAPLQVKVSLSFVPTLMESFWLTVAIIFATFLIVFRSGAARIMAMIPSLFAILVMFGVMRLTGMTLNVATILIASTVLGTSENDQIHFFYHFQEGRKQGTVEQALQHTLFVSGRAIFFATLINAGGFVAFGMADLPPIRQFGLLSALAFVLSMIADFTALPAALWLVFRAKPDEVQPEKQEETPPAAAA
ncbi:MAG: MMPL family transporter [Polyangiaceae bacterium]|nr:MMPL family transporter [Polyangiaceae bacterium]